MPGKGSPPPGAPTYEDHRQAGSHRHPWSGGVNLEIVDLLLESGADFEASDNEGNTALMLAETAQAEATARTPGQERSSC